MTNEKEVFLNTEKNYRCFDDDLKDEKSIDTHLNIYCDSLDGFHFYLWHIDQVGFRIYDDYKEKEDKNQKDSLSYFDPLFSRMTSVINKSRINTKRFNRLTMNKYNISSMNNSNDKEIIVDVENGDDTFLDDIYSKLSKLVDQDLVIHLKNIIDSHEYDTESLHIDVNILKEIGICNILLEIQKINANEEELLAELMKIFEKATSFANRNYIYFLIYF